MTLSNSEMCLDILVTSIGNTSISLAVSFPSLSSMNFTVQILKYKTIYNKSNVLKITNAVVFNLV